MSEEKIILIGLVVFVLCCLLIIFGAFYVLGTTESEMLCFTPEEVEMANVTLFTKVTDDGNYFLTTSTGIFDFCEMIDN